MSSVDVPPKEYGIAIVECGRQHTTLWQECKKNLRSSRKVARELGCHRLASRPNFLCMSCGTIKNWTLLPVERAPVDIQRSVIVRVNIAFSVTSGINLVICDDVIYILLWAISLYVNMPICSENVQTDEATDEATECAQKIWCGDKTSLQWLKSWAEVVC